MSCTLPHSYSKFVNHTGCVTSTVPLFWAYILGSITFKNWDWEVFDVLCFQKTGAEIGEFLTPLIFLCHSYKKWTLIIAFWMRTSKSNINSSTTLYFCGGYRFYGCVVPRLYSSPNRNLLTVDTRRSLQLSMGHFHFLKWLPIFSNYIMCIMSLRHTVKPHTLRCIGGEKHPKMWKRKVRIIRYSIFS